MATSFASVISFVIICFLKSVDGATCYLSSCSWGCCDLYTRCCSLSESPEYIVGIVIGALVGLAILVGIIVCIVMVATGGCNSRSGRVIRPQPATTTIVTSTVPGPPRPGFQGPPAYSQNPRGPPPNYQPPSNAAYPPQGPPGAALYHPPPGPPPPRGPPPPGAPPFHGGPPGGPPPFHGGPPGGPPGGPRMGAPPPRGPPPSGPPERES